MWSWLKALFGSVKKSVLPPGDSDVANAYVEAGTAFGGAVSDVGSMGECIGFEKLLTAFQRTEEAYSARGYRTLSVDAFVRAGGWGRPLAGLLELRAAGEEPVLHGQLYREHYLGKITGIIQMNWPSLANGEVIRGNYEVPSTEYLLKLREKQTR